MFLIIITKKRSGQLFDEEERNNAYYDEQVIKSFFRAMSMRFMIMLFLLIRSVASTVAVSMTAGIHMWQSMKEHIS